MKKDEETKRNLGNERAPAKRKTKKLLQASVGPTTGPAFYCLYKEVLPALETEHTCGLVAGRRFETC